MIQQVQGSRSFRDMKRVAIRCFSFRVRRGVVAFLGVFLSCMPLSAAETMTVTESEEAITIARSGKPVLVYRKAVMPPPAGQDPAFARSGFIHPLHAPSGGVVTGIHPSDHIHHMGLWHAWVRTEHEGAPVDFWNLKSRTGTIRYAKTVRLHRTDDMAGFTVLQEHVKFVGEEKSERVVLDEWFTIRARYRDGAHVIDHDTVQMNVTSDSLELPAYRYGGCLAYRAPMSWNADNSDYLTSEGKTRIDGHATRGRWCAMFGPTAGGDATVSILCHADNFDAPQRMRIWDNGKIFFNYVPIQEHSWRLEPAEATIMRYRIVVSDGKPDADRINRWWSNYSNPSR